MSSPGDADFLAAHDRHWRDAEYLLADKRLANADLLYGYSAECALKAAMIAFGLDVDERGHPKQRRHRVHFPSLWSEFKIFMDQRPTARYLADLPEHNPFLDWTVERRYEGDHATTPRAVRDHRGAAHLVSTVVQRLIGGAHGE